MGYKEEIFERLEQTNFRTVSEISSWLAGPKSFGGKKSKAFSYNNFAVQLQEPFAIRELASKSEDFDELRDLKNRLDIDDSKTKRIIENRMSTLSQELAEITEKRREERLERERIEKEKIRIQERIEREEERLFSSDRRKRKNAQRQLEKLMSRIEQLE